jgi:hypothetical protein
MKAKDYLSGAFSALAITIVGGIVVYYVTKEPEQKTRESLTYSIRSSASFSGSKEQMSVASVNIQNRGGRPAKNVIATIQFDSPLIRDLASESIPGAPVTKKITSQSAIIEYPAVLPGETIVIDFLLKSPATPKVVIRSDESLARQLTGSDELMGVSRPWNTIASALVPLSGLLLGVVSAIGLKTLRNQGAFSDKNNTGFLLLHSGLVDEAESVLLSAVRDGSYDPFTLSNLATCYVVRGDTEKAKALISAATYHSYNGHASAVLALNQAFLYLHLNDRVNAMECLENALSSSPNEIRRYLENSVLFNPYRSDPDFIALLKSA